MENFLIYLLKTSALLGIFYLSYLLLLKKETTFQLNRRYLLYGMFTAAILPAIYFTRKVFVEATPQSYNFIPEVSQISAVPVETPINWWQISGILYLIVTAFFILRLGIQLGEVLKIILSHNFKNISGLNYLEITENQLPFSFFNYIVFNPDKHSRKDLELILEHEKIHAKQWHSADILLVNLVSCFLWFNPFAWFYKKSVEQNLEFIADRETVKTKAEIKEYQHALIKVSIADLRPALTNHFYQSFIKKRILMLNKKSSTQSPAWKLSLLLPVLLTFMLLFNVNTEAQVIPPAENKEAPKPMEAPEAEEEMEIEVEEEVEMEEQPEAPEVTHIYVLKTPKTTWTKARATSVRRNGASHLGDNPLYILNGKKFKASKLKNKYIGLSSKFEILSGNNAKDRYGEDAENGVIIIPDAEIIKNFNKEMKDLKQQEKFRGQYIMVGNDGRPNFLNLNFGNPAPARAIMYKAGKSNANAVSVGNNSNVKIWRNTNTPNSENTYVIRNTSGKTNVENVQTHTSGKGTYSIGIQSAGDTPIVNTRDSKIKIISQHGEPLYIIDGIEQPEDFEPDKIDPENIASMMVLKGDKANEEYGQRARNGVVKIRTKKLRDNNNSIFLIKSSLTQNEIEDLKKKVKDKTGYTLELNNIERNDKGIITNIEVKFYNLNSMVNSEYNNTNGIPNIHVGLQQGGGLIISAAQ